ncbi:MAG: CCA tRNA nucleotidyltransferase [Hyphomicrobiales bacterium]|nr:CCA tRNA nucleotidyltransferase [Hyphomicrobiales bacterium]
MLANASFYDDPALQRVLTCLNGDGEETRIAGGAVRNALFRVPVKDIDLATTALPEEVMRRAQGAGCKTVPTGIEHGTITVIANGTPFEVTTLREDIETNGRHAVVRFGRDFAADAMRRDFTINALFADTGRRVHDYVGGLDDIAERRVRFIGDASQRIAEDYLRIMRLFRIHAAYGHGPVDRESLLASIAGRRGMLALSKERIGAELQKLLEAPGAPAAVEEMTDAGLLGPLLGGVPLVSRFANLAATEQAQNLNPDTTLRLAALAALIPEDAERLRDRLRLSNLQTARMAQAIRAFLAIRTIREPPYKTDLYRFLFQHGRRAALDGLLLAQADAAPATDAANWRSAYAFLHDTPEPRLPFTGSDLIKRGVRSGPAMGAMLKRLQAAWIRAGFPKEPEVLARLLQEALEEHHS